MSIEVSMAIIAVCFIIILLIGIALAFCILKFLNKTRESIASLTFQVQPLIQEATKTLISGNEITTKIKNKIDQTDPLFSSISKTGHLMECFLSKKDTQNQDFKIVSFSKNNKKNFTIDDWIEWVSLGLVVWQKIKNRGKRDD